MKQLTFVLILALATFSQAFGKNTKKQERKVIPMVNFVPSDFSDHVKQQFAYSPDRASFIIEGKKSFIHYNSQGKGFVDKELGFDELIDFATKHDSVFIFTLSAEAPNTALGGKHYWGYVKNGQLFFYDFLLKTTYPSLKDLIIAEHGSLDRFMSFYQSNALNCMKNLSSHNELYTISNENEAKEILRKDIGFPFLENPRDYREEIKARVMSLLSTRLVLDKNTQKFFGTAIYLEARPDTTDATALPFNKSAFNHEFSLDERKIIEGVLAERRLKVGKAYQYLKDKLYQEKLIKPFSSEADIIREIRKSL